LYTIGICNDETSSACLFLDGKLIAAVSEERFTRKKMDNSFPFKSIDYLLSFCDKKIEEVDIAYAWAKSFDPNLINNYLERDKLNNTAEAKDIFRERIKFDNLRDKKGLNEMIDWYKKSKPIDSFNHFYHHEAHAASCTFLSPFNNGICITVDGVGDFESLTIWKFDRLKKTKPLEKIYSSTTSDSLGYFYGRITGLLGFKPMRHEGKITGLAAHGDPIKALPLMKKMIDFEDGKIIGKLGKFFKPYFQPYNKELIKAIEKYEKEDIAAAAQEHIENLLTKLITYQFAKNNITTANLMCAGGVFGNVKITQKLKELPIIKNIFVQPQMGDGGLCIGAAALSQNLKGYQIEPLSDVFLGPSINVEDFTKKFENDEEVSISKPDNLIDSICDDLLSSNVIGLLRGRMEFGPRSLCNRSILFKTSDKKINHNLNKRLDRTEFMPFAPVIREERAKEAFEGYKNSDLTLEYMTSTIDCTDYFKSASPAVVHIDQSARPQIIKKEKNSFIWDLLVKWENLSDEPSLVNTSFNSHEEPIICNAEEAIKALKNNIVDIVYIEDYRVQKRIEN